MLQKLQNLSAFSAACQALREGKSPLLLDGLAAVHKAHFAAGFCQSLGKAPSFSPPMKPPPPALPRI